MNYNKYLPVGTVVMLKNGRHRVMIVGFAASINTYPDKIFDYIGCLYPEGIFTYEQSLNFDHSDIEKIYFVGYSDDEEKSFKIKLNNLVNKLNNSN